MTSREVPLSQGRVALVDEADYQAVTRAGKWSLHRCDGRLYAGRFMGGKCVRLHSYLTGWPLVDHRNGDGLDNRRANLRAATPQQNSANNARPRNNTSGFKGVGLYKRTGRWRAYITVDQVAIHLGYFDTPEESARVYDAAALEHFGEFARHNFPLREDQIS